MKQGQQWNKDKTQAKLVFFAVVLLQKTNAIILRENRPSMIGVNFQVDGAWSTCAPKTGGVRRVRDSVQATSSRGGQMWHTLCCEFGSPLSNPFVDCGDFAWCQTTLHMSPYVSGHESVVHQLWFWEQLEPSQHQSFQLQMPQGIWSSKNDFCDLFLEPPATYQANCALVHAQLCPRIYMSFAYFQV